MRNHIVWIVLLLLTLTNPIRAQVYFDSLWIEPANPVTDDSIYFNAEIGLPQLGVQYNFEQVHASNDSIFIKLCYVMTWLDEPTYCKDTIKLMHLQPGNYTIVLFANVLKSLDSPDCDSTLRFIDTAVYQFTVGYSIGINNLKEGNFTLSPNPAASQLQIALPKAEEFTYSIYSIDGRLMELAQVPNAKSYVIDVSILPKGLYIIEMRTGSNTQVSRFIKI